MTPDDLPAGNGAADRPVLLVVDDALVDRTIAEEIAREQLGMQVLGADSGGAALKLMERQRPHIVLTDMQMPGMNGLELVEAVRNRWPGVPVVLMTAHGSEELAVQALQQGATSYVSKKNLIQSLAEILQQVWDAARADYELQRLHDCFTYRQSVLRLDNDPALVRAWVAHSQRELRAMKLWDENTRLRVGIALHEAVSNALYHGNLELSSELRQNDDSAYWAQAAQRRRTSPYCDRRILVEAKLSRSEVRYVIADEGPGFDPQALPDPTSADSMERESGRGLLLIRSFMDEVTFNPSANQITLVKRHNS